MSDAPLFQDADKQEALYAPDSNAAEIETDEATGDQPVDVPVVGLAPSGMATPATVAGPPGVLPPGTADLPDDEDDAERDPAP